MAGPYDNLSDDELEAEIRRLESQNKPQQTMPRVLNIPQSPSDVRKEARDNRGEARDDIRTGIAQESEARSASRDAFATEADLRKEFNSLPAVKEYQTVIRQYNHALQTQPNPTGDQALITAYAKMLDPTSVVREQEFNTVQAGDSALGKMVAKVQKELGWDGAGMLRPEVRERVRKEMQTLTSSYNDAYNQERGRYSEVAKYHQINPDMVVGRHLGEPYHAAIKQATKDSILAGDSAPNAMLQDTVTTGPGPGLAGGGDGEKSIPIPDDMQAKHVAYLQANKGRLDPDAYAAFRQKLDSEYGFPASDPNGVAGYADFARRANDAWSKGGNVNLTIPPISAKMTGQDQLNATIFNNPVGAAVMAAPPLASGMDEIAGGFNSFIKGTSYQVERDKADAMRQAASGEYPVSSLGGAFAGGVLGGGALAKFAPKLTGAISSTMPRIAASGGVFGGTSGALENNDNRALGLGIGTLAGAGGAAGGAALAPKIGRMIGRAPRETQLDRAVSDVPIDDIRFKMSEAQRLGVPYALADATEQTRALAGSAARFAPKIREAARDTFTARQAERGERAITAVERNMAPRVDTGQRKRDIYRAGNTAASPLYEEVFARAAPISDDVDAILRTRDGQAALKEAYRIAENEGFDPKGVGLDLDAEGNVKLVEKPTFRALDLVKRGLDSMVEGKRNPTTGVLDTTGDPSTRALDGLRTRLRNALDNVEPKYKEARAEYETYAKQADALDRGYRAPARNVLPRDMDQALSGISDEALNEYRRGYATRVVDDIANQETGDPFKLFYGTPGSTTSARRAKVGKLFPNATADLDTITRLERDMADTYQEVVVGSQTQPRRVQDEQFAADNMVQNAAIDMASGLPVATLGNIVRNQAQKLIAARNLASIAPRKKAEEIGPRLIDTSNQQGVLDYLDELELAQRARAIQDVRYRMTGGAAGGLFAPAVPGIWGE